MVETYTLPDKLNTMLNNLNSRNRRFFLLFADVC